MTNEGQGQAKFFGWPEPFPDVDAIKAKHAEAESITDQLCASGLAGALDAGRYGAFTAGVQALRAATPEHSGTWPRTQFGGPTSEPKWGRTGHRLEWRVAQREADRRPEGTTIIVATDLWCSSECTPPCQGGGRGFKSRQVRHHARSRSRATPDEVTRSGSSVGRARA